MIIVLLCDPRWNERDIPQVAQYCVLILLYGSCDLYFDSNDRKPNSAIRMGGTVTGTDTHLIDKLNGLSTDLGFAT
jgi:cation/acetate symporter